MRSGAAAAGRHANLKAATSTPLAWPSVRADTAPATPPTITEAVGPAMSTEASTPAANMPVAE
jgi:hypothetical protein